MPQPFGRSPGVIVRWLLAAEGILLAREAYLLLQGLFSGGFQLFVDRAWDLTDDLVASIHACYGVRSKDDLASRWRDGWSPLSEAGLEVPAYRSEGALWIRAKSGMTPVTSEWLHSYFQSVEDGAAVDFSAVA